MGISEGRGVLAAILNLLKTHYLVHAADKKDCFLLTVEDFSPHQLQTIQFPLINTTYILGVIANWGI